MERAEALANARVHSAVLSLPPQLNAIPLGSVHTSARVSPVTPFLAFHSTHATISAETPATVRCGHNRDTWSFSISLG